MILRRNNVEHLYSFRDRTQYEGLSEAVTKISLKETVHLEQILPFEHTPMFHSDIRARVKEVESLED